MADSKISALTAGSTPDGTELLAADQGGNSRSLTVAQLTAAARSGYIAAPAIPTFVAAAAFFHSTGVPTTALPTGHATNDILVLVIESANDGQVAPPAGYQQLGPENGIGVAQASGAMKLSIFWKRDGGSESAPTLVDTGDHTAGFMFAVRGCATSGDPFHLGGQGYKFTASTTGTAKAGVTVIDNCLVAAIFGHAWSGTSDNVSASANADLGSVTDQLGGSTTDGVGGGCALITGTKATAGTFTNTTVTWSNTTVDLSTVIVFIPTSATVASSPKPTEVQTFIGSPPALKDAIVLASGARRVHLAGVSAGASGTAGRNAATAAGGGGGGGGMFGERWMRPEDLAGATVTVAIGAGGQATSNTDGASGNAGADFYVQYSSTNYALYLRGGQNGTVSATGSGGAGGPGGGNELSGYPAAGAYADVYGSLPAKGGSGATTSAGGSGAQDFGGGGGGGGGTSSSGAGGKAMMGGGGGGGGRAAAGSAGGGAGGGNGFNGAPGDGQFAPYGGAGGAGGTSTAAATNGYFPGGGGGGGGSYATSRAGAKGGEGCLVVTTYF